MRYGLLLVLVVVTGCDAMARFFEPMPGGFVRFTPDTSYLRMWREVEACSGKRGSMRQVEWFYYPGRALIPGEDVGAMTRLPGHDTFFADSLIGDPWRKQPFTVRHEMLHHLTGSASDHPEEFFGRQSKGTFGRCGHIVSRP